MLSNPVLKAIKERRSVSRFEVDDVDQEKIDAIIEAARWAPSWVNSQPWSIILIRDTEIKQKLHQIVSTMIGAGIEEAPIIFAITVDTKKDPHHYIEDGAAVTQNMELAAYSLGLSSYWIGVLDISGERGSSEEKIKQILNVPEEHRVISILPVGFAKMQFFKERRPSSEFTYLNSFGNK